MTSGLAVLGVALVGFLLFVVGSVYRTDPPLPPPRRPTRTIGPCELYRASKRRAANQWDREGGL